MVRHPKLEGPRKPGELQLYLIFFNPAIHAEGDGLPEDNIDLAVGPLVTRETWEGLTFEHSEVSEPPCVGDGLRSN